jgi:hypothetical protein
LLPAATRAPPVRVLIQVSLLRPFACPRDFRIFPFRNIPAGSKTVWGHIWGHGWEVKNANPHEQRLEVGNFLFNV